MWIISLILIAPVVTKVIEKHIKEHNYLSKYTVLVLRTTWYTSSGEDSISQGYTCIETIASHSYVPSCTLYKEYSEGLAMPN